jgi:hypothetical protein
VRDGQTSSHRPRLVVSRSTCPPLPPPPPREQLCNRYCSNKHTFGPVWVSSPALRISTLVYAYVVDCASASPYANSSSTHRFPDERTPIEATPLSATSAELGLGVGLGLGLDSWYTSPRTRSPSSLHPPFTHYSFSPRSLVCGGQTSPHKPLLVVSHSTCSARSSSPRAHSFVLGTAVINNN